MLLLESSPIVGVAATLFATFTGGANVTPPSTERLKNPPWLPPSDAQTMSMPPMASTAICGADEPPESFERFCGTENVKPALLERLKKTARYPGLSSSQAR